MKSTNTYCLCARYCSRYLGHSKEQNKGPCPHGVYSPVFFTCTLRSQGKSQRLSVPLSSATPLHAGRSRPGPDLGNVSGVLSMSNTPHSTHHLDSKRGWKLTFNNKVQVRRPEGVEPGGLVRCCTRARAGYRNCCCCLAATLLTKSLFLSVAAHSTSFAFLSSLAVSTRVLGGACPCSLVKMSSKHFITLVTLFLNMVRPNS